MPQTLRNTKYALAILSICLLASSFLLSSCARQETPINAQRILGNPDYLAFSYGGFRGKTREEVPTVSQIKDDLAILSALNIKLLRTYNTQDFPHAANLLQAIHERKQEHPDFEMYVMLGAWIKCKDANTDSPNHDLEDLEFNQAEIDAAIRLAKAYPDIVKIIAVGNEAMVHWATSYFVHPSVIHKWVAHLQDLKSTGELPQDLWITSSDNFASWGGGSSDYHNDELTELIKAVDFISLHTYPFHDTYYNPDFWGAPAEEAHLPIKEKAAAAILRAKSHAVSQYQKTADYIKSLGIEKPIHIGETGWASIASEKFGTTGSQAADEYKQKLYYQAMRDWTLKAGMSCFYFEIFDEPWKDSISELGSENHFGLINIKGEAKYALWPAVDAGLFDGLTRDGKPITKTYNGDEAALTAAILPPPLESEVSSYQIRACLRISSLLVRAEIDAAQDRRSLATRVSDGFGGRSELRFRPNRAATGPLFLRTAMADWDRSSLQPPTGRPVLEKRGASQL